MYKFSISIYFFNLHLFKQLIVTGRARIDHFGEPGRGRASHGGRGVSLLRDSAGGRFGVSPGDVHELHGVSLGGSSGACPGGVRGGSRGVFLGGSNGASLGDVRGASPRDLDDVSHGDSSD